MNLPLRAWTLAGEGLPERLTAAREDEPAFSLPGAQALSAFADLLGADASDTGTPDTPTRDAPFELPAPLPEDVTGEVSLSREIDFGALSADAASLRFAMLSGRGEVLLDDPARPGEPPRRLAAFSDGPLVLDLSDALHTQKRLRVTLRFDPTRPAGVSGAVTLHTATDAILDDIALRPQSARLLELSARVTAIASGAYQLVAQPCPPAAPLPGDMIPARATSLRLEAGQSHRVQLTMSVPGASFVPGRPYDAPALKLTLRREGMPMPCDDAVLMYGYPGAPAQAYLPLTPRECLLPPQTLIDRLRAAHIDSVLLPVPAPDALYIALTRAGIAARQIAPDNERARIGRFPCVTFIDAAREEAPSPELSAWQLCGMTAYIRKPDPTMTPPELLREAAGHPVDSPRAADVLAWLRAVRVRLTAEAARQGRGFGALCAPGEWDQPDVLDALTTALAPAHLSALPLRGAWWTGAHFSATLRAFIPAEQAGPLRAVAVLEDAQGGELARVDVPCPAKGGELGLIEAALPDMPCVLELTTRLYCDDKVIEESAMPVYVGERGPLEAAFNWKES